MITIQPGDPSYSWAPAKRLFQPSKVYDWPTLLDGAIHTARQDEDFLISPDSFIRILRRQSAKQNLKVTLTRSMNGKGQFEITFATYKPGTHPPLLPDVPRASVNQHKASAYQAPTEPLAVCKYCENPLSGYSAPYGECARAGPGLLPIYRHEEHHTDSE